MLSLFQQVALTVSQVTYTSTSGSTTAGYSVGWFSLALINAGLAQDKNRGGLEAITPLYGSCRSPHGELQTLTRQRAHTDPCAVGVTCVHPATLVSDNHVVGTRPLQLRGRRERGSGFSSLRNGQWAIVS